MFKNTFQSGFLSILYSIGSKPLQIWDKKVRSWGAVAGRGAGAAPPPRLGAGDGVAGSCVELELRGGQVGAAVTCPQAGVTEARGGDVVSAAGGGGCVWGGRSWGLSVLWPWCGWDSGPSPPS